MVRLSSVMFLQFVPPGLWTVTLSSYIGANTGTEGSGMFDSSFVGIAGISGAIGALVSPLLFGALADSWFRTERMIALMNLTCAGLLALLCSANSQGWFLVVMIAYYQFSVPAITLNYSIALRHLAGQRQYFPAIRVSGTVGWIVAMWIVGSIIPWWWQQSSESVETSTWPMKFAIVAHLIVALYALTLPKTPPLGTATSWRRLLDGCLQLLSGHPRLVRFLLVSFCATVPAQFYNLFANLYLNKLQIPHAATKLSGGQVVEIFCMLALPMLLYRWGPKRVFVIGILAWIVRYVSLAFGDASGWPMLLVWIGILLHGVCYVFVYITGFIYVDHAATPQTQSAAQGLLALVTTGLGHLVGALVTGWLQARYLTPPGSVVPPYDWQAFFLTGAFGSLLSLGLFWLLMGFKREVLPGEIEPDEAV
nr:MFS transporter [Aeoliella straminimaris]